MSKRKAKIPGIEISDINPQVQIEPSSLVKNSPSNPITTVSKIKSSNLSNLTPFKPFENSKSNETEDVTRFEPDTKACSTAKINTKKDKITKVWVS